MFSRFPNKIFFLVTLFVLNTFLIVRSIYATETITDPVGVDLSAQDGPNPAPPIGLTVCGKTMCQPNESCVKYPFEADEHCVPNPIPDPIEAGTFPPSCWKELGKGNGRLPADSDCWNYFKNTQEDLSKYQKTCIYEPIAEYSSKRKATGPEPEQPFELCAPAGTYPGPDWPGEDAPGGTDPKCIVSMLVYTDVTDATLGSYGPDQATKNQKSSDFMAQNYLYNSLFDRPDNLSPYSKENNRESYRTYWRLLPENNQANLRSYILNLANENQIENIHFNYTNSLARTTSTSFKDLYSQLSSQIILFLHWPFIRQGCLVEYPVCPEYAQAIKELKPVTQTLTEYLANTPGLESFMSTALESYRTFATQIGADTADSYAAFTPLDFDSVRGYIVKRKDEFEDEMYHKENYDEKLVNVPNAPEYTDGKKPALTNISRESIPYIGAIHQGLLSSKFGLISAVQPQWVIDTATNSGSNSDYKIGNTPQSMPEVKLARKSLLSQAESAIEGLANNPFGWLYQKIVDLFTKEDLQKVGYTENDVDNDNEKVRQQYVNFKGCPLPVSYHMLSPQTGAGSTEDPTFEKYNDHHQVISIDGDDLRWTFAPEQYSTETCNNGRTTRNGPGGIVSVDPNECTCHPVTSTKDHYPDDNDICIAYRRRWRVYGVKHGKALTVLNNPKQTDIKNAIVQEDKYSLYKTLLPDSASKKKITDASVDAPVAYHAVAYQDTTRQLTSTAPNGQSKVFNLAEPINRINNRAQDTMHLLQNCWTVPDKLQNSPRCKLALVESEKPKEACTGEAFRKIIPNPESLGAKGQSEFDNVVRPQISDDLLAVYAEAEKQTGVPCEVLAGIHYREADNDPNKDLQSGADLNGRSLQESAIEAAKHLLEKAGGAINDIDTLVRALSWYNGGGNSNCQATAPCSTATARGICGSTIACMLTNTSTCTCNLESGSCRSLCGDGYPFPIPVSPGLCPPKNVGYDDPYVTELWKSPINDNMYILYTYDCTATQPVQQNRLGTLTTAIGLYNDINKEVRNVGSPR